MRRHRSIKCLVTGGVCVLCVGAFMAGTAFASDYSYPVPSSPTDIDSNLVTFGSQGDIWGEILGISDVARNMSSDYSNGVPSKDGVAKDTVVNLFGSDVNTNPNPYYKNLIYNANTTEDKQVNHYLFADQSGLDTGIDRGDTKVSDTYGGVSPTMSYRPDIVLGNCATSWQDPGAIVLRSDGVTPVSVSNYELSVSAAYDSQVNTIRSLKKTSGFRQSGDGTYNPYYVENLSMYGNVTDVLDLSDSTEEDGSINFYSDANMKRVTAGAATIGSTYAQMYNIVKAIKGVMADDPTKTTRYGDPEKIAAQYESYGRGLQDYVLAKIADGTVKKKKVAVISDADTENNTLTLYMNSPAGTYQGTGGSFSGPYKHMEALENICDNVAGTRSLDDTYTSWGSTNYNVTKVISDVSQLKDCDAIILAYSSDEANVKAVFEAAGISESDLPPMLTTYATSTSRGIPGFPMLQTDGLEMEAEEIGFVYPEIVNPVYALAYYYTQFYHVKSDTTTLSNVLSYNIETMSLPKGVTADLSNYSDSIVDKYITEGLTYYAANKATIDSEHPKLTTTSHVTLPGSTKQTTKAAQAQTVKITTSKLTVKAGKSAKVKATAKTVISFAKKSGNKKIKLAKNGKLTVKKGLKKGTYKIKVKVSAAATSAYKAASATKTIKIKVK